VRENIDHNGFLTAYLREIEFFASRLKGRKITTIFFGGGTPSLMPLQLVEKILEKIATCFAIDKDCEITLEANPTSFESSKFFDFKKAGINRLSIGVQALNDADLKFLGREHSAQEAIAVIKKASKIFDNFSFDLIYARPKQTLSDWSQELNQALEFNTKHLSLYQLTIEKGTKFFSEFQQKKFIMPDENLSADFYDLTNEITASNGFELYEISNYAKKNFECAHNLVYWQGGDYLGIGAGAHSRVFLDDEFDAKLEIKEKPDNKSFSKKERQAIMMIHEPISWLQKVKENGAGIQTSTKISSQELLEELILMGLRLREGISGNIFQQFFDKSLTEIFDFKKLQNLVNERLLEVSVDKIKITDKGRILSNSIIAKVVESI